MKKWIFLLLLFVCSTTLSWGQTSITTSQTTAGNYTFIIPTGVTFITIECYGGGGGGGGSTAAYCSSSGGAAGSYVKYTIAVTVGQSYKYTVGAGGLGISNASGGTGGNTFFGNSSDGVSTGSLVLAVGGAGGITNTVTGTSTNYIGDVAGSVGTIFGNIPSLVASPDLSIAGGNGGSSITGTSFTKASGAGGNSYSSGYFGATGIGGAALTNTQNGNSGSSPGGGGGGGITGFNTALNNKGGTGGTGGIAITYTLPQTINVNSTTSSWLCPAGVSKVFVECWGGGGAGGSASSKTGTAASTGGGGSGGAYASGVLTVSSGTTYTVTVATTVSAPTIPTTYNLSTYNSYNGIRINGNPSWFNTTGTLYAEGGQGGQSSVIYTGTTQTMGLKGSGSKASSIGTTTSKGGDGFTTVDANGSGGNGGSSGGSSGDGNNATSVTIGAALSASDGAGGFGGGTIGNSGGSPGGGGGGARAAASSTPRAGGAGGVGQVIVYSYAVPALASLSPSTTAAGSTTFTLTVTGTNFFNGVSAITWNGVSLTTTYVNSTTLTASINASYITTPGTMPVGVVNSGVYGIATATSTLPFTISGTAYTVTYNGNGSTGGIVPVDASSPYASGATVTVKANTGALIKSGYSFTGWNTLVDGSGTTYAASGSVTFSIAANTTLYAQWVVVSAAVCPSSTACTPSTTQNVCQGVAASPLTANVTNSGTTGTPTLQYQWYYNTSNSNTISGATTVVGATNSTYVPLSSATEVGTRYYFCVAYATDNTCGQTNASQSLASNAVQVVVTGTPTTPTAGSTGTCSGGALSLTSSTVSTATYAWTGPISFTSSSQNPTVSASATTAMSGTYSVVASVNGCPSAAGTTVVTINTTPSAPTAGSNSPICASASLAVTATTIATATYAWTGPNGFTSTSQNPTVSASATAAMAGTYSVTATVSGCTSSVGTTPVTVNAVTAISSSPSSTSVTAPATASFTVTATGTSLTYQWQFSSNSGGSWTNVSSGTGGTTNSYTTGATSASMSGYLYQCVVSGTCGTSTSTSATLTISTGPCFSEYFASATSGDNTSTTNQASAWVANSNFPTISNVNQAGGAVKLGTGSAVGSLTSGSLSGVSGDVTVSLDVKGWTNVEGSINVTLNGVTKNVTYTAVMASASFETKTLSFTSVPANSTLIIATSAKRAFIDNVTITCSASCSAPTTQATFSTSTTTLTAITQNFAAGNGAGRVVLINTTNSFTAPANLSSPVANTVYSGSGQQVVFNATSGTSVTVTNLSSNTTYYFAIYEYNCSGATTVYNATENTASATTLVPAPEINIKQGATTILTGDSQSFGNVEVGASTDLVFTIENLGTANLTLTTPLSVSGNFSIVSQPSSPVAASSTTTFTVRFTPTALGATNGSMTITNNDSNEGSYILNFTGTGTNSSSSDVSFNSASPTSGNTNLNYTLYQSATISNTGSGTNGSIGVMGFYVRDGGAGLNDTDLLSTTLTSISFSVTNPANIRSAALFNGSTFIATVAVNGVSPIVFSGISGANVICADDSQLALNLRITFNQTVTDNQQMIFTVSNVTANTSGSTFAATNGGAAASSSTGDTNRIEVTADRLAFGQQSSNTTVNVAMTPSVTVSAIDIYSNIDFDYTGTIGITSSGTLSGVTVNAIASNGVASYSTLTHTATGTGLTLTAATTGLAYSNSVQSNPFNITAVTYTNGDYRTTATGTWHSTTGNGSASWQQYNSGTNTWTSTTEPSTSTTKTVYIYHSITLVGTNTATSIVIENGGILNTSTITPTFGNVLVKSGGTFKQDGYVTITGTIEVEDYGTFQFNSKNTNSRSTSIWFGTEKFHPNSTFIITNADTTGNYLPFETEADVDVYTDPTTGYSACFGNLIIDNSTGGANLQILPTPFTKNLTHKDLIFRNNTSSKVFCAGGFTTEIGGNLIMESTYAQNVTFITSASSYSLKVKGDIINNSTKILRLVNNSSGGAANVTVEGNITLTSSATLDLNFVAGSTSSLSLQGDITVASTALLTAAATSGTTFNFTGTGDGLSAATTQTIDIASTGATRNQYTNFNVNAGAYVQISNQNFELGKSSNFSVNGSGNSGGTFDFGFSGTTALNVTSYSTGTNFTSQQAATLKISSPDGILNTSGSVGNVQTTNAPTYNQTATFWYIGKANQVTGTGITTGSTAKIVIAELSDNTKTLTLTNGIGISSTATLDVLGGKLDIRKGIVIGTTTNDFTGTGRLVMSDGEYRISTVTATPTSNYLPQLSGYSSYSLTGGTVHLNAANATQIVSGTPNYYNLKFSGSNTYGTNYKGISSATTVSNTITISETAVVDINNKTLGSSGTNLTMTDTAYLKLGGSGLKPDATGTYSLASGTTIEYYDTYATNIRAGVSSPVISYANVIVNGTNVATNYLTSGIQFQSGGNFTVKNGATFKCSNMAGFNSTTVTAISSTNNPTITLETGSTVEYAGTNQNLTPISSPNPYYNMVISGSGTKSISSASEILVGNNLNVTAGTLQIDSDKLLTVTNMLSNSSGNDVLIKNRGSLVQINDGIADSGTIKMTRTSRSMIQNDYIYWGSPVIGDVSAQISATNFDASYMWDLYGTVDGTWNNITATTPGRGFITRVSAAGVGAKDFDFTGVPNNGLINVPNALSYTHGVGSFDSVATGNTILLANPYPSAINASAFITANNNSIGNIGGTLYFWTSFTQPNGNGDYTTNDYASWNATGATGTIAPSDPSGNGSSLKPTGKIAAGQGFFAQIYNNADIIFNNAMRVRSATDNSQFFRNNNVTATDEQNRIWLSITNSNHAYRQTLVGYVSGATNDRDLLYDGDAFTDNAVNLYSVLNTKPMVIQGRSLPFDASDLVPLGYKVTTAGDYTINIDELDGLFVTGQPIYIEDLLLSTTHELTQSPYTFNSDAGVFDNRFVLRYTDTSLGIDTVDSSNTVLVFTKNNQIFVQSELSQLKEVAVYDVLGRLLFDNNNVKSRECISSTITNQQTLIVKIKLDNEQVITKKILLGSK
jgi:hypothetical protein